MKPIAGLFFSLPLITAHGLELPADIATFIQEFCIECHSAEKEKGDFRIDTLAWDLTDTDTREQWDLVFEYVDDGDMPSKKASKQPDDATRAAFLQSLDEAASKADQIATVGGTTVRRLNRVEYLNTLRDMFGFRMINLPPSFPDDATQASFDTMPEGLFLSPAVMEAYHEVASTIADRLVPLPDPPTYQSELDAKTIGGDEGRKWYGSNKEAIKFTGYNHSGWVGAIWDSGFVAPTSGAYRFRLLANAQADAGADGKPLRLSFYAFDPTEEQLSKRYLLARAHLVAEIDIPAGEPTWLDCAVPVEAGETIHIYCGNRLAVGSYPTDDLNRTQINGGLKKIKKRPEPTVELREMKIDGPVDISPRVKAFFGTWPPSLDRTELEAKLLPVAERAFRRPLSDTEAEKLIASVLKHGEAVGDPAFAWHYGIRRILCAPEFLYREAENTESLSEHALASRLSYFLWSSLPDQELLDLAAAGKLSHPSTLAAQTRRLLADPKAKRFVKHFTGQWLGNRTVASLNVCDSRYQWDDNVRYGFVRSTEMFFDEVLRENLPISTFVDSNFTYANSAMQVVWEMKGGKENNLLAIAARQRQSLVWPEPERISFTDPAEEMPAHVLDRGGVLGLPGVLAVTGDGVESSPILRGVWVLENLLGKHPPPPPKDVPALDIDTSKATTVRETLKAHTKVESCAVCHRAIDPLGLSLENYDAIGGWRTRYQKTQIDPIDASATMPDGLQLDGAGSIKKYLLDNPEIFTRCLLTKLLEYGAGRKLSVGDKPVMDALVEKEPEAGYGFQDLIEAAVSSEVFRAK